MDNSWLMWGTVKGQFETNVITTHGIGILLLLVYMSPCHRICHQICHEFVLNVQVLDNSNGYRCSTVIVIKMPL